jgi:Sec-independent protein secretion pathway component TatC
MLAVPMWMLYEAGVLVSSFMPRQEEEAESSAIKPSS